MDTDSVIIPQDHSRLRAAIALIEGAYRRKYVDDLYSIRQLIESFDETTTRQLRDYVYGAIERIKSPSENVYRTVDDRSFEELVRNLHKIARGDFNEALIALRSDLHEAADKYREDIERNYFYRDFDPSFFTPEQQAAWAKYTSIIENGDADEAQAGFESFDHVLTQTFGDKLPVLTATYRDGDTGYTASTTVYGGTIYGFDTAPFADDVDDYVISHMKRREPEYLTPDIYPQTIAGYELQEVSRSELLPFEALRLCRG